MLRKLFALTIVMFVFGILTSATTQAALVGFSFDANDFIQKHGTDFIAGSKTTQDNPRRLHKTWASQYYNTFSDYLQPGTTQSESGNTYANWADGLGTGEGITAFNIWLCNGQAAQNWGETIVTDPHSIHKPVGYAPSGWNTYIEDNPWGEGWLVNWWTDSLSYAINSVSTLGMFGFNADVYIDGNGGGYDSTDPDVVKGDSYRIWFGSYKGAQPGYWNPSHSLAFDDDWSSRSGYAAFQPQSGIDGSGVGWEGVLTLEAGDSIDPIPEPGTLLLLGSGLIGLAGYGKIRIRRKKK